MEYQKALHNDVAFVKLMDRAGYSQKQIVMMVKRPYHWVNRVIRQETFAAISGNIYKYDKFLETMKETLDKVLEYRELAGAGELTEMDKSYILILKECGGKLDKVRTMYADRSLKEVNEIWHYEIEASVDNFNGDLIGINDKFLKLLLLKPELLTFN